MYTLQIVGYGCVQLVFNCSATLTYTRKVIAKYKRILRAQRIHYILPNGTQGKRVYTFVHYMHFNSSTNGLMVTIVPE